MSHSFIQNCCWITLQVSHHEGWKTCVKMEGKTNFSRRLKQFGGLHWLIVTPPPLIFYDRSTPLPFQFKCRMDAEKAKCRRVSVGWRKTCSLLNSLLGKSRGAPGWPRFTWEKMVIKTVYVCTSHCCTALTSCEILRRLCFYPPCICLFVYLF